MAPYYANSYPKSQYKTAIDDDLGDFKNESKKMYCQHGSLMFSYTLFISLKCDSQMEVKSDWLVVDFHNRLGAIGLPRHMLFSITTHEADTFQLINTLCVGYLGECMN